MAPSNGMDMGVRGSHFYQQHMYILLKIFIFGGPSFPGAVFDRLPHGPATRKLPLSIRKISELHAFKRAVKTHLFRSAFSD